MKRKLIFTIAGLFIFLFCFTTSVFLRDYFYEQKLRNDIHKVKVGMTGKEAIEILGKPSSRNVSDSPSEYWCYDTNSIAQILDEQPDSRCGYLLLEMSSVRDGKVAKVIGFKD